MSWRPLACFCDRRIPKLDNLRRAAAARLHIPPTWWLDAAEVGDSAPALPAALGGGPIILRSASPGEDGTTTSSAGQLLSLIVEERAGYTDALQRVVAALPRSPSGQRDGAVFVQPLVRGAEAG